MESGPTLLMCVFVCVSVCVNVCFRLLDEVTCTLESDLSHTWRSDMLDNKLQSPCVSPLVTHL